MPDADRVTAQNRQWTYVTENALLLMKFTLLVLAMLLAGRLDVVQCEESVRRTEGVIYGRKVRAGADDGCLSVCQTTT